MKLWMMPVPCHRGLTTMLASLTGSKEGSKGLMELRLRPISNWVPDNTSLHSISRGGGVALYVKSEFLPRCFSLDFNTIYMVVNYFVGQDQIVS